MKGISYSSCLTIFSIVGIDCSQPRRVEEDQRKIGCQQRSTKGRDYVGEANTTIDGIPCQRWSDTQPLGHDFTDFNFCRNPIGSGLSQVWCYTTDPEHERQYCSVPFCPTLKALDFSLDNDD